MLSFDTQSTVKVIPETEKNEHREALQTYLKSLGYRSLEDWYLVPASSIVELGGRKILRKYNENLPTALRELYPEHTWQFWKFLKIGIDSWKIEENQRHFLTSVAESNQLGSSPNDDWHRLEPSHILEAGGKALLGLYQGSLCSILKRVFPAQSWERWRFASEQVPSTFFRDPAEIRNFITSSSTKRSLKVSNDEDWYSVSASDLINSCSASARPATSLELSRRAQSSHLGLKHTSWLGDLLRETGAIKTELLDWKFIHAQPSSKFWSNSENVQKFLLDLVRLPSTQPEINSVQAPVNPLVLESLQSLTRDRVRAAPGGAVLLSVFDGSVRKAIQFAFPNQEQQILPWRFNKVPHGFWSDQRNQRTFLDWCENELSMASKEGWYNVTQDQIVALGGFSLLAKYKKFLPSALKTIYPEHKWQEWRFANVSRGFWDNVDHQREFFDYVLSEEIAARSKTQSIPPNTLDLWYSLSPDVLIAKGGQNILKRYNHSLRRALEAVYPSHTWYPWLFTPQNQNIWSEYSVLRAYFDWLAPRLGVKNLSDWYSAISAEAIQNHRGGTLLLRYYQSPVLPLLSAYPEHEWHEWKFSFVPLDFWMSESNRKRFFVWLQKDLGISEDSMDQWYQVTASDFSNRGGGTLLADFHSNSISDALQHYFPHHLWEPWKFVQQKQTPLTVEPKIYT